MVEVALVYVGPPDVLRDAMIRVLAGGPTHVHVLVGTDASPAEVLEAAREALIYNVSVGVSLHVLGEGEVEAALGGLLGRVSRVYVADRSGVGMLERLRSVGVEVVPVEL